VSSRSSFIIRSISKAAFRVSSINPICASVVNVSKPKYRRVLSLLKTLETFISPEIDIFNLSKLFCTGSVLEIGAMSEPAVFSKDTRVKYADVHSETTLKSILQSIPIPKLYAKPLVKLDFILKAPRYALDMIADESFDSVYTSHVLEHCPNFLFALQEQIRVTRTGGHIYGVIPNKHFTYDRERETTSLEKIVSRFNLDIFTFSLDEATELVTKTVDHPLYLGKGSVFANEILNSNSGIHHFHVFDEHSLFEILVFLKSRFRVDIKYFATKGINMHFCLEKVDLK
jgi:SAM-dependent methyltransferase